MRTLLRRVAAFSTISGGLDTLHTLRAHLFFPHSLFSPYFSTPHLLASHILHFTVHIGLLAVSNTFLNGISPHAFYIKHSHCTILGLYCTTRFRFYLFHFTLVSSFATTAHLLPFAAAYQHAATVFCSRFSSLHVHVCSSGLDTVLFRFVWFCACHTVSPPRPLLATMVRFGLHFLTLLLPTCVMPDTHTTPRFATHPHRFIRYIPRYTFLTFLTVWVGLHFLFTFPGTLLHCYR